MAYSILLVLQVKKPESSNSISGLSGHDAGASSKYTHNLITTSHLCCSLPNPGSIISYLDKVSQLLTGFPACPLAPFVVCPHHSLHSGRLKHKKDCPPHTPPLAPMLPRREASPHNGQQCLASGLPGSLSLACPSLHLGRIDLLDIPPASCLRDRLQLLPAPEQASDRYPPASFPSSSQVSSQLSPASGGSPYTAQPAPPTVGTPHPLSQRRQWHPTPVLLPAKPHGQRSLVGCSPWGH